MLQSELEDLPGTVILSQLDLKLGELKKIVLIECLGSQFCDDPFIDSSGGFLFPVFELKLGHFEVGIKSWEGFQVTVEHFLCSLWFSHALFELDESHPSFLARTPFHPSLEDIPSPHVLSNQLFHVCILEPELIFPGQVINGSFPNIPGVVDELVLHLHLRVLQPQTLVGVVDLQRTLEH